DNNRVLEYDAPFASGLTGAIPASRVFGQAGSFTGHACNGGGITAGSLCHPTGVTVDGSGRLYVVDQANCRVLEYDTPLTGDTTADRVFGQPGGLTAGACSATTRSASSLYQPTSAGTDAS